MCGEESAMKYELKVRGSVPLRANVAKTLAGLGLGGDSSFEITSTRGSRVESGVVLLDAGAHTLDAVRLAFTRCGVATDVVEPVVVAPVEVVVVAPVAPTVIELAVAELADLSVLASSVRALIRALRTGEYDDIIDALIDGERAGQNRKSAIQALESRKP
jgi:hypothetical protein